MQRKSFMCSLQNTAAKFISGALLSLMVVGTAAARPDEEHGHDQGHPPPVYMADFHNEQGHTENRDFDLSNPADAKELTELIRSGRAHEVLKKEIPTLQKIASLGADLAVWTLVIFGLLFFILRWKAWPMMLDGLNRREQGIRSAIDEAHKAREETARLRDEVMRERAKAADEARATVEQARRDAVKLADELKAKAVADIRAERDRLRRDLELARDAALQELWAQTAQLATLVSGRTISRALSVDDHRQLAEEAIADIRRAGAERQREVASV
jgi:F-type H+-transporting ATPase subunit b